MATCTWCNIPPNAILLHRLVASGLLAVAFELMPGAYLPSETPQKDLGDSYVPYNKPGSIKHWLENTNVTEDFVFFIDADMVRRTASSLPPQSHARHLALLSLIALPYDADPDPPSAPPPPLTWSVDVRFCPRQLFLKSVTPELVNATPGHAVSAAYDYLIGVDDPLVAPKFLEEQYRPLMRKARTATYLPLRHMPSPPSAPALILPASLRRRPDLPPCPLPSRLAAG